MKRILGGLGLIALMACNNGKTVDYKKLYEKSMEVKDYNTAITSVQMMLQVDSSQTIYMDTLPELYVAVRNFEAADYYNKSALNRHPEEEKYLQLKALLAQQFGRVEEEIDVYNKLYAKTNKLSYLYQIAAYQFATEQMEKASKTMVELESKMGNSTDSVDFMVSETAKQKVPIRAAVYNMKAYMVAQNRDLMGAKKYFEMALKEYPEFVTARQNLMQLMNGGRQR